MRPSDDAQHYTRTAIALHWLIAILVIGQFAWGWWMQGIPKQPVGPRVDAFNLHKSIGMTIFLLMALRLAWRAGHPPPAVAADADLAVPTCATDAWPALRGPLRPAARWLSRFRGERISGQVLRHHAAGLGGQARRTQGSAERGPPRDQLGDRCSRDAARRRRAQARARRSRPPARANGNRRDRRR